MKIIQKDILTVEYGIICHQVNCFGAMGAGLAGAIAEHWPHVKTDYRTAIKKRELVLGGCLLSKAQENLFIAHIAGQSDFGRGRRYTDYESVREGIRNLRRIVNGSSKFGEMPIYFPYGFGCGLAGGDWNIVSKILNEEIPHAIICKLG